MSKNIYPCFKCGEWFETTAIRKAHKCGKKKLKPEPVKQETVKDKVVDQPPNEIQNEEVSNDSSEEISLIEFNREEAISSLKEAGIVKDKRSTTNKSDEELIEMLKDI